MDVGALLLTLEMTDSHARAIMICMVYDDALHHVSSCSPSVPLAPSELPLHHADAVDGSDDEYIGNSDNRGGNYGAGLNPLLHPYLPHAVIAAVGDDDGDGINDSDGSAGGPRRDDHLNTSLYDPPMMKSSDNTGGA